MAYAFGLSPPMAAVLGKVQMGWCSFATSKLRPMCHENGTKMNEAQLQVKDPKSRPNDPNGVPTMSFAESVGSWPSQSAVLSAVQTCLLPAVSAYCTVLLPVRMFQQSVSFADFPRVALPKVAATSVGVQHQAQLPGKYQSRNRLATLESAPLAKIYQRQF